MERDYGQEIDDLRSEISQLKKKHEEKSIPLDEGEPAKHTKLIHAEQLAEIAGEKGISGAITYYGAYCSSGRGFHWETDCMSTDTLLGLEDDKVTLILSSLGNKQRYAMVKELLKQPRSVNEIIENLNLGTTGQVYHHLKALQAADFVVPAERGKFEFKSHRVQALLMILTGVYDVLYNM